MTYIRMFLERKVTTPGRKPTWHRMFPLYQQQIEWHNGNLYVRGMGGGFGLTVLRKDLDWVYCKKVFAVSSEEYRVSLRDYNRLKAKAEEEKNEKPSA